MQKLRKKLEFRPMRLCQLLWLSKNYPLCLNLISECSAGTLSLWTRDFWQCYSEWDAHLQRGQAKHQRLRGPRAGGQWGPRVVCLSHRLGTLFRVGSVWKAPLSKTKLCFSASKPQLPNNLLSSGLPAREACKKVPGISLGRRQLESCCLVSLWKQNFPDNT